MLRPRRGGAARGGITTLRLCRRVRPTTALGGRNRAAVAVAAAATRVIGSGAKAEWFDVPVGTLADEVWHVGEEHQRRRQPHLSCRGQSAKGSHHYTLSRGGLCIIGRMPRKSNHTWRVVSLTKPRPRTQRRTFRPRLARRKGRAALSGPAPIP